MRYQFGDKNWDHAYYVLVEFWWTLGDRTLKTHSSETLCFDVPVYKIPFWVAPAPENRWFVDAWSVDYSHAEEPRVAMFLRKRLHLWLLTPLLSMLAFSVVTSRARYPIASSSQNNNCKDLSERYACIHGDKYNFFRELHANTNSNVQLDLHSLRPHVSPLAMPTFSFCFFFPQFKPCWQRFQKSRIDSRKPAGKGHPAAWQAATHLCSPGDKIAKLEQCRDGMMLENSWIPWMELPKCQWHPMALLINT